LLQQRGKGGYVPPLHFIVLEFEPCLNTEDARFVNETGQVVEINSTNS
jgi:hypothetical protein